MIQSFEMVLACIMAFYRDRFEDTREYPVAYSSAVVVFWLGFLVIAVKGALMRMGMLSPRRELALTFDLDDVLFLVALLVLFLAMVTYYTIKHRWRRVLDEYDDLPDKSRATFRISSLAALVGVLVWAVLELFLFGSY